MTHRVSIERVEDLVIRLQALSGFVDQQLADLDRTISRLQSTWTGDAADRQREAHARWSAGAREMHDALRALRQAADTAKENYSAAVAANVAMWGGGA